MKTEKEIRKEHERVKKLAEMFPDIPSVKIEYEAQKSVFDFVLGEEKT